MDTLPYTDFRTFIEEAKKVAEWQLIEGADWNNEIGALIEATAELDANVARYRRNRDILLARLPAAGFTRFAFAAALGPAELPPITAMLLPFMRQLFFLK